MTEVTSGRCALPGEFNSKLRIRRTKILENQKRGNEERSG